MRENKINHSKGALIGELENRVEENFLAAMPKGHLALPFISNVRFNSGGEKWEKRVQTAV